MACRLIAADLDGTLIRDDLSMSPRVRSALQRAREGGIGLVLASGRSFRSLRPWVHDLAISAPVISYQGAAITDPLTERSLYQSTFDPGVARDVVAFARETEHGEASGPLSLLLFIDDEIYVEHKVHSDQFYNKWFGVPHHVVGDLHAALDRKPTKFIIVGNEVELDLLRPLVEQRFGQRLQIVRSHRYFLEGLSSGVTKGSALAWLAQQMGVSREDTMAIGDSDNDTEMIRWAGLGVAMGNALPEVKAVAQYVAPTVDEDGAAEAIESFCLQAIAAPAQALWSRRQSM